MYINVYIVTGNISSMYINVPVVKAKGSFDIEAETAMSTQNMSYNKEYSTYG